MFNVQNYYRSARENEEVFRTVLRNLRDNRLIIPGGIYVPADLDTESSLDEIFQKYSEGQRMWKFTIISFSRPEKTKVTIGFTNVAPLSGGGAELEYLVNDNNSVKYQKRISQMMS